MTFKVGLIGCGEIGRLRAAALAQTPQLELTLACDIEPARAQKLAEDWGSEATSEWHQAIQRQDLDAIIISTPPSLHAEMTIAALQAGKHVLCEKPLARNPAECRHMVDAAEQNSRFLATGFNYRFYPSVRKARELLSSGLIGDLVYVRSYAGYSATEHNHEWLHDVEVMGGGALMDNGIHLIDLTACFLGGVEAAEGLTSNRIWRYEGCEDNGFLLLRGPEGRTATLHASWTEWRGYRFQLELFGERGCIQVSCFPMLTTVTWTEARGGNTRKKTYTFPRTFLMEHLRSYRWVVVQSFVQELATWSRAIQGEESDIATGEDGKLAVELVYRAKAGTLERPSNAANLTGEKSDFTRHMR